MEQRLLITGLSGFIGQELARQLRVHSGFEVVGTYLHHPVAYDHIRSVPLDIADRAAVDALWQAVHPDVVIHCAAVFNDPAQFQSSIVAGTANVAAASARQRVRLIHMSTDMIFDGTAAPYSEDAQPSPITPYGAAKAEAEQVITASGLQNAVIVRTPLVNGLEPLDPRSAWVLDSVRGGTPITLFTDEYRCPIWVADLAAALLELVQNSYTGILNLAGAQRLSRYELGVRLCRAFGLSPDGITATTVAESGMVRPRDCTLDIRLAQQLLQTRLRGIDEVLEQLPESARSSDR